MFCSLHKCVYNCEGKKTEFLCTLKVIALFNVIT